MGYWPVRSGGSGFEDVPRDGKNLVLRAVELVRRRTGTKQGARLRLIKRIPTAAGLGGGSSDAAAALVAANLGWKLGLSLPELAALAAELGSDVPFFLNRGPAVCRGRGERIEPADGLGLMNFVVVRPPEGLATAAVYGVCRPAASPRPCSPCWMPSAREMLDGPVACFLTDCRRRPNSCRRGLPGWPG